jgi:hypothetical protein
MEAGRLPPLAYYFARFVARGCAVPRTASLPLSRGAGERPQPGRRRLCRAARSTPGRPLFAEETGSRATPREDEVPSSKSPGAGGLARGARCLSLGRADPGTPPADPRRRSGSTSASTGTSSIGWPGPARADGAGGGPGSRAVASGLGAALSRRARRRRGRIGSASPRRSPSPPLRGHLRRPRHRQDHHRGQGAGAAAGAGAGLRIALAAPTGKAAARLTESVGSRQAAHQRGRRAAGADDRAIPEQAQTIHRLLGYGADGLFRAGTPTTHCPWTVWCGRGVHDRPAADGAAAGRAAAVRAAGAARRPRSARVGGGGQRARRHHRPRSPDPLRCRGAEPAERRGCIQF